MVVRLALSPHPDSACGAVTSLEVEIERRGPGLLSLGYSLRGAIAALRLAEPADPERRDGLWQRTCLEVFVRGMSGDQYYEVNLSPSTEWAAYGFDGYRDGMRALREVRDPEIAVARDDALLALWAAPDLSDVPGLAIAETWRVGLAAVVVENDGTKSYWALNHPPGAPDFHHKDCFALELAPPTAP